MSRRDEVQSLLATILVDLVNISRTATLPDGDGVTIPVVTWATEWCDRMAAQGVIPAESASLPAGGKGA